MKNLLLLLLAGTGLACSPIPELAAIVPAVGDGGTDGGIPDHGTIHRGGFDLGNLGDMRGRRGGDMAEPKDDMGVPPVMGPCPAIVGPATSFCYWPMGTGNANLATALTLLGTDVNCKLLNGRLSVTAASDTCSFTFTSAIAAAWGFTTDKPTHLAFSYSIRTPVDHAILTVNIPAGSMNEVIKVNGIYGSQNVASVFAAAGVTLNPGFSVGLAGTAATASVSFDWISVWQ